MARSRTPLNVFINGRLTGRLTQAASGAIEFAYAGDWLKWQNAFSISRSLLLREDRYIGTRVFAVSDNLLPG
jgi:serine/threonine-protein kinase HipA